MPKLVIHTPQRRVADGARSFEQVSRTGIGPGYGLTDEMAQLPPDTNIVLLRKDRMKSRAEGKLVRITPTGDMAAWRKRYDVHVKDWKKVPYKAEPLDHWGVNLL